MATIDLIDHAWSRNGCSNSVMPGSGCADQALMSGNAAAMVELHSLPNKSVISNTHRRPQNSRTLDHIILTRLSMGRQKH